MTWQPGNFTSPVLNWTVTSGTTTSTGTAASAVKAARTGHRHVCTGLMASVVGSSAAPIAIPGKVTLYDGTSTGTALHSEWIGLTAAAGTNGRLSYTGLAIYGTPGNAMTWEFAAVPSTSTFQNVTLVGYSIPMTS